MSQSTRSSMLLNFFLLAILALSSLVSSRPISKSGSDLSRSDLQSRSPSPRVIPSADEYKNQIMKSVLHGLGLDSLNDLDDWKSKLEDSGVIDDSNSPDSTVTDENNATVNDEDSNSSDNQQIDVGFVGDVLSTVIDKFGEALNGQDEVTLKV